MVLLVIDVQKGITDERLYNYHQFIENTSRLIQTARDNNVEIIYVQHDDGPGTGFSVGDRDYEIADQVAPIGEERIFNKTVNSSFSNPDFVSYLKQLGDSKLMIVGLQTNFCIDATVKSAFDRGYRVFVPAGCNSTFDNDYMNAETTYRYYNEMMWPERFARCVSTEEAERLLRAN